MKSIFYFFIYSIFVLFAHGSGSALLLDSVSEEFGNFDIQTIQSRIKSEKISFVARIYGSSNNSRDYSFDFFYYIELYEDEKFHEEVEDSHHGYMKYVEFNNKGINREFDLYLTEKVAKRILSDFKYSELHLIPSVVSRMPKAFTSHFVMMDFYMGENFLDLMRHLNESLPLDYFLKKLNLILKLDDMCCQKGSNVKQKDSNVEELLPK